MNLEKFQVEFGRMIRETRLSMKGIARRGGGFRSLSQVDAAAQMGCDYRHYQNIETGKIKFRIDTLILLVHFYNLRLAILPGGQFKVLGPEVVPPPESPKQLSERMAAPYVQKGIEI